MQFAFYARGNVPLGQPLLLSPNSVYVTIRTIKASQRKKPLHQQGLKQADYHWRYKHQKVT